MGIELGLHLVLADSAGLKLAIEVAPENHGELGTEIRR
jgi:hypothetical protein